MVDLPKQQTKPIENIACSLVAVRRQIHKLHQGSFSNNNIYHIYATPPLGQDMTQGHFISGV